MNWEAVGAIAEFLAAVGVIVSFVYLARQIRQNTSIHRRSNVGDISHSVAAALHGVYSDGDMSALAMRAFSDLESLDPVQRYRFDSFFYSWLASFERALLDARDGEYPEEYITPLKAVVAGFLRTDGGRAWWEQRRAWFTPYANQAIDAIIDDQEIEARGAGPPPF